MPTPRSPNVDKRSDERKQAEKIYLESKGTISMYDNLDDTWKAIDGDVFCKSIMEDAMSACNLKIDRSIDRKSVV